MVTLLIIHDSFIVELINVWDRFMFGKSIHIHKLIGQYYYYMSFSPGGHPVR